MTFPLQLVGIWTILITYLSSEVCSDSFFLVVLSPDSGIFFLCTYRSVLSQGFEGGLCTSLGLSLCATTLPSVFYVIGLSHFHLPEIWIMSPPLGKTVRYCQVLPAVYSQAYHPSEVGKSSAHPFHFPSLRDLVIHHLKIVVSCFV